MKTNHKRKLDAMASAIETQMHLMRAIVEDERSAHDDKSERWQESEKGQEAGELIESLEGGLDEIENALSTIRDHFVDLI